MTTLGVFFDPENNDGNWRDEPEVKYCTIHEDGMKMYLGFKWRSAHRRKELPTCMYPDLILLAVF